MNSNLKQGIFSICLSFVFCLLLLFVCFVRALFFFFVCFLVKVSMLWSNSNKTDAPLNFRASTEFKLEANENKLLKFDPTKQHYYKKILSSTFVAYRERFFFQSKKFVSWAVLTTCKNDIGSWSSNV